VKARAMYQDGKSLFYSFAGINFPAETGKKLETGKDFSLQTPRLSIFIRKVKSSDQYTK
jgi:hypothetical protein